MSLNQRFELVGTLLSVDVESRQPRARGEPYVTIWPFGPPSLNLQRIIGGAAEPLLDSGVFTWRIAALFAATAGRSARRLDDRVAGEDPPTHPAIGQGCFQLAHEVLPRVRSDATGRLVGMKFPLRRRPWVAPDQHKVRGFFLGTFGTKPRWRDVKPAFALTVSSSRFWMHAHALIFFALSCLTFVICSFIQCAARGNCTCHVIAPIPSARASST